MKIAVIGFGYWGPNLVRNFNSVSNCQVAALCDFREERLTVVNKLYPSIKTTKDPNDIFSNPDIDAVVIATPVFTHFDIAKKALESSKH
ncbi:MAG: Gfo/Idh/MocA family oxidoreductase, partial [Bacteroidia bacterium]